VCNIGESKLLSEASGISLVRVADIFRSVWEIWTNGLYRSTLHRVMHTSSNYRVSIPFFYEPAFDALVEPLPAALRIQADSASPPHPNRFAPIHAPTLEDLKAGRATLAEPSLSASGMSAATRKYEPVVYGEFLLKKVSGNFDTSDSNNSNGNGSKEIPIPGANRKRY
jgi:hypothetical protein